MSYKEDIIELEKMFKEERYFELISVGVQLLDIVSDELNQKDGHNNLTDAELDEVGDQIGIKGGDWKKMKNQIMQAVKADASWKYKVLGIFNEILDSWLPAYIDVTPALITKINTVHTVRNNLHHKFFDKSYSKKELKSAGKDCLEICKLFEEFDKNGCLD